MIEEYLSGFLFRNLRLLVEDLRQTLLSLGIFGLNYWLSHLSRFRMPMAKVEIEKEWLILNLLLLRWWRLLNRFRLLWLAPALHLRRAVPRNGFSRLGGPLVSFHIVLFLGLAFLDNRLLLCAPAVLLIPRVALAARLVVLPLLDFSWNWGTNFRRVTPIRQGLLLTLLLVIESFRRIGLVPAVAGEFLIAPVLSKTSHQEFESRIKTYSDFLLFFAPAAITANIRSRWAVLSS